MRHRTRLDDRQGFALLLVLLLAMVVGALAMSAITMFGNARIVSILAEQEAEMEEASIAGTELARALINRSPDLFPDDGYTELPGDSVEVRDARGQPATGYTHRIYAGPSGVATGQFGVFGSVVSVVEDDRGNGKIFRREMVQESFAKFAYFTDKETSQSGSPIYFAPGDQLFGPVHSNDQIRIMNSGSGPVFHGPVTTHETIQNKNRATFREGYTEGVGRIELPKTAELGKLRNQAIQGNAAIASSNSGGLGEATTRIEFIAIDIDGDGDVTGDNEGFFKVYRAKNSTPASARWVSATTSSVDASPNCGHRHVYGGTQYFHTAQEHGAGGTDAAGNAWEGTPMQVLSNLFFPQRARCYLGGSDSLNVNLQFVANDGRGSWQPYGVAWAQPMPAAIQARPDRDYLFPIGRAFNPDFRGVIHVAGDVAVSGVVRGRVTLAASGDIVIADDVQYATDPAAASCQDILGLFSGKDVVVSDNSLNAPRVVTLPYGYGSYSFYRSFDNTEDEIIHAVILALGSFTVANYSSGSDDAENCEGQNAGRGCLYVTGGIIQDRRGAVGQQSYGGITGYLKRYSYDQCAASGPPPYFPTTGYFGRGRLYEVNPVDFDIAEYWDQITAN